MYYLRYRPSFSIRNKIYTTTTNKYKKLGKLEFKFENSENKSRIAHFYRPLRKGEYRPLGDIIIDQDIYAPSRIKELNGDIPVFEVNTTMINGGVKSPIGYTEVYNNGDLIKGDETYFSVWKPKAPDGYLSMGHVIKFERGNTQPSKDLVWCVRADLVESMDYTEDNVNTDNLKRLSNEWFNSQIGFWIRHNPDDVNSNTMRYFTSSFNIDKKSGTKYDREYSNVTKFELQEPSELDNPVYTFKDFTNLTEDNITLEDINKTGKDRDSCCFKVTKTFKSGEFTEYELYNNLSDVKDNDYKALNYDPDRNGKTRCLNVPYSYWNDYYKELSPYKGLSLKDKMKKSLFLKQTNDNSGDSSYYVGEFPADKQTCRNLTGSSGNSSNCDIDIAKDQNIKNKFYINKLESCPGSAKVGNIKIVTSVESCKELGGNPKAQRGVGE